MSLRSERARKRAIKQRNQRIALVVILVLAVFALAYFAFGDQIFPKGSEAANDEWVITNNGLKMQDTQLGTGAAVKVGDTVSVHYSGYLEDGTKFDSSLDRGTPFEFIVGQGRVIPGWEEGLVGMQPGGKRTLLIPPNLGYGVNGYPPVIPANATLKFDIELLAIK